MRRGRLHRLQEVHRGWQDLVLDLDQADGFIGDVLAVGGDDGNRRADFKDLLVEETSVGRTAAQLHVLIDRGQIAAVQDRVYAGELLGLADVDRLHPRVRMRTAQRARVQRARHGHVLGVLAETGDHPETVHAGNFLSDDRIRAVEYFRWHYWRRNLRETR